MCKCVFSLRSARIEPMHSSMRLQNLPAGARSRSGLRMVRDVGNGNECWQVSLSISMAIVLTMMLHRPKLIPKSRSKLQTQHRFRDPPNASDKDASCCSEFAAAAAWQGCSTILQASRPNSLVPLAAHNLELGRKQGTGDGAFVDPEK